MSEELKPPESKPCPFCGGACDPKGWASLGPDGMTLTHGPECEDCGATAVSVEAWDRRVGGGSDANDATQVEALARGICPDYWVDRVTNGMTSEYRDLLREQTRTKARRGLKALAGLGGKS